MAPFGQVIFRLDGSYFGIFPGGAVARMPDSPSIMMSRASGPVAAMSANLGAIFVMRWDHSEPVRVLPEL